MGVFRNKDFSLIFCGQLLSSFGNSLFLIALPWYVLTILHSTLDLMLTGVSLTLPRLLGLFVGVFVDRWNKKAILILSDLLRFVLALSIYLLLDAGCHNIYVILTLVILISALGTFFSPALSSFTTMVVPKDDLSSAASFQQSGNSTGQLLGMLAGGLFIVAFGIPVLFLLDAISFLVSVLSISVIRAGNISSMTAVKRSFFTELKTGFNFIFSSWGILRIIFAVAITNFSLSPIDIILAYYVKHNMQGSSTTFGLLSSCLLLGDLTGSFCIGVIAKRVNIESVVKYGLIVLGVLISLIGLTANVYFVLSMVVFSGLMIGVVSGSIGGVLFEYIPRELMGRVRAPIGALSSVGMPLGMFVFGFFLTKVQVNVLFLTIGIFSAAGGMSFFLRLKGKKIVVPAPVGLETDSSTQTK